MQQHVEGDVIITNKSDEYAQIALQGPLSEEVLQTINRYKFIRQLNLSNSKMMLNVAGHEVLSFSQWLYRGRWI